MRKELIFAALIYFVTMFTLFMAVYRFLEDLHMHVFNFFLLGALVLLVAVGWGYMLVGLIFAPKKQIESTVTTVTNEIMHELNIPLSTIQANTAMLKKNLEDEKSLKRLQRIEDASLRLKRLYDELVYTLRKEMHEVEKERVDIAMLIAQRIHIFQEQKRNAFDVHCVPYEVYIDKIGFEQIFDNLISNAMKYSDKENPISVVLDDNVLSIIDRGVGMSSTELLQVYERYFQADEQKEGAGIGLNLVKRYCDEVGIGIHIYSEKNEGTTVALNLSAVQA